MQQRQPHKRPMKAALGLILSCLLLLSLGGAALGDMTSSIYTLPPDMPVYMRVTTFAGEMPRDMEKALRQEGFSGYSCVSGALVEQLAGGRNAAKTAELPAEALLCLEKGGKRTLMGMVFREGSWGVAELGAKALLPGRDVVISASDLSGDINWYLPMRFTLTYALEDGGSESYGVKINNNVKMEESQLWNPHYQLWQVTDYTRLDANGDGLTILSGDSVYRVAELPFTREDMGDTYPAYVQHLLCYMDSIADFPTTREAVAQMAEASWDIFGERNMAVVTGVNMRKYPTMQAKVMVNLKPGVLVRVLEEEPGVDAPWYHVAIGHLRGFVSGTYVRFAGDEGFANAQSAAPLVVAEAQEAITLREDMDAEMPGISLPKGTRMHVLGDTEDGWLLVCVPKGPLSWQLDLEGTVGYVLATEVLQGVNM